MINNVVLVGRIVEEPTMKNFDGEFKGAFITLAVSRPFKNFDNIIESDFIKVAFWEGLAENAYQYCHKGCFSVTVEAYLTMPRVVFGVFV